MLARNPSQANPTETTEAITKAINACSNRNLSQLLSMCPTLVHNPSALTSLLREDDDGAVGGFVFDGVEGVVGLVEGEDLDLGFDTDLAGELEEVAGVGASHVGDAANLAFAPEELVVVEGWHLVEVDGVDGDDAAFAEAGECADDDSTAGGEGDGAVEFDGRLVVFGADPFCAEGCGLVAMGFATSGDE